MTIEELLSRLYAWTIANPDSVALILTTLFALYRMLAERMTFRQSLFLMANTLKDENKMTPEGQFRTATVEKLQEVAKLAETGKKAAREVETVLAEFNEQAKGGVRIGSYKGKPIYLEDLGRLGLLAKTARDVFKGILGR